MFITIDTYIALTGIACITIFALGTRAERRNANRPDQPTTPAAAVLRQAA